MKKPVTVLFIAIVLFACGSHRASWEPEPAPLPTDPLGDDAASCEGSEPNSYVGCEAWPTPVANAVWSVFDFAVVDEAQDISVAHVRFLAALGNQQPNALFFAGDLGQRIFQQPFSWKALGVDIRGRSRTLRVNYRTSHQIRTQADRLLGPVVTDVDGNSDDRSDTVSVFNGPPPTIQTLKSQDEEITAVEIGRAHV